MNKLLSLGLVLTIFVISSPLSMQAAVRTPKEVRHGMVASDHYLASQAGADILKKGGNAVDAAVATSLVISVVRNQSTGIGGGGFMVFHSARGENIVIDYRETAPAKAGRDMFLDKNNKPVPGLSTKGYKAVGIPGNLAGLNYVLNKYGTMKLKDLIKPAIKYAETGFIADEHFSAASKSVFEKGTLAEFKKVFFTDGKPKKKGDLQKNPELASTLRLIGEKGVNEFYRGSVAKKIASAMQKNGGLITMADLASYKPKLRSPLKGEYKGYEIITMPPPSSGGAVLLEILNIIESFNLGWNSTGYGSSRHVHLVAEAMKHAYADRAEYMGDPDFVNVPADMLISKKQGQKIRNRINENKTNPPDYYGSKMLDDDGGTTHYSVIDKFGNVISATETINTYFGSQVVIPGTGILMNNEMDDFSVQPGVPNAFGLIGNQNNAVQAGKKPLSSMTPTIILKDKKPFMAVGASGGPRIISGTLQAIINVIDFGMNAEEAVSSARIHHQWMPDKLFIEKEMPFDVRENLIRKGHVLSIGEAESAVQAILVKDGKITAASDPRKGGFPEGY